MGSSIPRLRLHCLVGEKNGEAGATSPRLRTAAHPDAASVFTDNSMCDPQPQPGTLRRTRSWNAWTSPSPTRLMSSDSFLSALLPPGAAGLEIETRDALPSKAGGSLSSLKLGMLLITSLL